MIIQYLKKLDSNYPNIAYIYAIIGYTFQAFTQILFKSIAKVIPPFYIIFLRAFLLSILNTVFLWRSGLSPYISQPFLFKQVLKRLTFSTSFAVLSNYCVKFLPVSTVASLNNTGPIFIFFIQAIYYKKPINKISLILTVVSFCGVLLILQPSFLFDSQSQPVQNFQFLSILVIIAAMCFAMTMIYLHDIAGKVSVLVNLQYSYLGQMTLSSVISNFEPPTIKFQQIDLLLVVFVIIMVFSTMITQYGIFYATTLKKPSLTMPLGYLGIIVGFIADIFYFGFKFNFLSIVGIFLTSSGLLSKFFIAEQAKHKIHPKPSQHELQQQQKQQRISREQQMQKI